MRWTFLMLLCSVFPLGAESNSSDRLTSWPQWRGPLATGEAPVADPPLTWSETNNLKWKVAIPGFGTATPIVWKDRLFIETAVPQSSDTDDMKQSHRFVVLCLDRKTGKTVWERTVREEVPHEAHHKDHGYASASPVTDGEHLLAYFGSRGLHCFDLQGNLKWSKDFGKMQTRNSFGEGASPALFGNCVVVNWDDETDNDFIAALDKQTGKELWRTPRKEATGWSTPLIMDFGGKRQVIVNATERVRSYDLENGKELWACAGQTANAIPSPVPGKDVVYVTSGFRGSALQAISISRSGDLTGTDAIKWSRTKYTPYVPTPLLISNLLYVVSGNNGMLSCIDAQTGTPHFEAERLEGVSGIYASPVAASGRVYVLGRDGLCLVLKPGPALEILARNKLNDKTDASIALADKELFIRGHKSLYCLSE